MDLTSLLGSPQVWIGFRFHSDASVARPHGAQVDDVLVTRAPPVPGPLTYGFTFSASSTDPRVRHLGASSGIFNVYLWYYCSRPEVTDSLWWRPPSPAGSPACSPSLLSTGS
jgi:hypothetical protein